MSIYSGFSNRKVEDKYNSLLKQVITLMNQIIITMCKASNLIPFKTSFCKIQQEIKKLDTMKFSQPKFSIYLQPLAQLFTQLENGKDYRSQPQNTKERRVKMNSNQGEYSNKRRNSNSDAGKAYTNGSTGRASINGSSRNSNSNNNNNSNSNNNNNSNSNNSKDKRLLIGDNSLLYQTRKTISFTQHYSAHNNNNTKNNVYYEHNTNNTYTNTNTNTNTNKSKSFFMNNNNNNNKNSMNKPVVYKQNRYVQQSLIHPIIQQSYSHHSHYSHNSHNSHQVDPFRSRKIYRSRQGSHHLINNLNVSNIDGEKLLISSDKKNNNKNNNNYINNNNNNNNYINSNSNSNNIYSNNNKSINNSQSKSISFKDYHSQELSMQQLMRSNPLVERKMSAQKRRIKMVKWDIPQINQQQQDNENENENDDIHLQDNLNLNNNMNLNLNNNMEIGVQQVIVNKAVQQQPQSNLHFNKSIKTSKRMNRNKKQQLDQQQQVNRFQQVNRLQQVNRFEFNKSENNTPSFDDQLMYLTNQGQ